MGFAVTATSHTLGEYRARGGYQALERALDLFAQPEAWRRVQVRGMGRDFGWEGSAREYEGVYRSVLAERQVT